MQITTDSRFSPCSENFVWIVSHESIRGEYQDLAHPVCIGSTLDTLFSRVKLHFGMYPRCYAVTIGLAIIHRGATA